MFSNFFSKNLATYVRVEKYGGDKQTADGNM